MDYIPASKEEIEKERVNQGAWPVGEYQFEILDKALVGQYEAYTEERTSQKGNPMIQLVMVLVHPTGAKRILRDYLLSDNKVKLHDAMTACGISYGSGKLHAHDFIGRRGIARLGIGKDGYNEVRGYIVNNNQIAQPTSPVTPISKKDDLEDEVPF